MLEQKRKIFEETLTKAYEHDKYVMFLRELLDNMKLVAPNLDKEPYNTFYAAVDHYRHIGNYVGEDHNKVALFSVCLHNDKNVENARSMQRAFIKSLLKDSDCAAALVSFYTKDDLAKWRLSLVRLDYEFSNGKLSEKLTPAKRYSYLVGEGEPCHTAQERLYPIFVEDDLDPSLDELENAFSVEAVTKDFFDQYREKYLDLKDYLDTNEDFVAESKSRGFDSEQFAKKLMGQIVFLYFIQKKGWLGVNAFPSRLIEREYKNSFYRSGRKPKELMPLVYKQAPDGIYYRDTNALMALSPEDATDLSTFVKGDAWGTGPKDFMRKIFEGCVKKGLNFFDDYLEPLFYTGLNQNRGDNAYFSPLHRRIPFLNGGLFEEMEGYDWRNNDFCIPNEIFSNKDVKVREADGILDIFDRYNFTMAEDEPMEREVAIDPEMLGKVFENLLDVSDRKSKGAFYTPREIVHYMCQESLINYLCGKTQIPEDDIRKLILFGEYFRDEDIKKTRFVPGHNGNKGHYEFDKNKDMEIPSSILSFKNHVNRLQELDELLANVKVVDLAVGSGAFPVGMMTEIVKARDTITSYMIIEMNSVQRLNYRTLRTPYLLKRATIKNSIFACDIEASATDITKLRLWLSLVIDNQIMDQEDERLGYSTKPRELPNLDCNIICGNSLMDEFEGIPLLTENAALQNESENRQQTIYDGQLGILINELIELQSKLYDEKDRVAKDSLKDQIQEIYNQIVMEQIQTDDKVVDDYYQTIQKPSSPFVLWPLYFPKVFRDNGGFDIAIGNPPYIKIQNIDNDEAAQLKKKYLTATGKFDMYVLFVERAFELINKDGICVYIQPHRFLNASYGQGIRNFLKRKHGLYKFVHFGVNQVFDTATTYTGVFFYKENTPIITFASANSKDLNSLQFSEKEWSNLGNTWIFSEEKSDSIVEKILRNKTNLLDIFKGIYQGLITLGDDIFIMEGEIEDKTFYGYSKSINKNIKLEAAVMKPLLKGENIRRYGQPTSNIYVLYPHTLNKNGKTVPIDEWDLKTYYPKAYSYLLQFKDHLERKKVSYKTNPKYWYSLHRAREKTIFDSIKIITPQLQNYCNFAYDTKSMYPDAGGYILIIKPEFEKDILYYLGILNSSLFYHFIINTSTAFNNNYYYFKTAYIKPFHFPDKVTTIQKEIIINNVMKILKLRQSDIEIDTSEYEKTIDQIVFELYDITEDEQKQILVKYNVR